MRPTRLKPQPTPVVLATAGWVATSKNTRAGWVAALMAFFATQVGRSYRTPCARVGRRSNFPLRPKKCGFVLFFD